MMSYLFPIVVFVVYLMFTIAFSKELKATKVFTNEQKKLHRILIWVIPFLWVIVLKGMMEPVQGSYKYRKKGEMRNVDDISNPIDDSYDHSHHSHHDHGSYDHSSHDSGGHDSGGHDGH